MAASTGKRTRVGIELVRVLAAAGERVFTVERAREVAPRVGMSDAYVCEALYLLRRNGWIEPVRRGLYTLGDELTDTPVYGFEIAMHLVNPAAIAYRNAFNHHGLSTQIPNTITVMTTTAASVPRHRNTTKSPFGRGYVAGGVTYEFVQIHPDRFFGREKVQWGDGWAWFTDFDRTMLDGLHRPLLCWGFDEVLHAFDTQAHRLSGAAIRYAARMGVAVAKRLGWVLEHYGVETPSVDRLAAIPTRSYRRLDPTGPTAGPYNRRWMLRENLPGWISNT